MSFITLDFETFYDKSFSLRRLTTEEYVRGKQFEVIGVGVKVDDAPAVWTSGDRAFLTKFLRKEFDWKNSAVLAHNMLFDGAILAWYFGVTPAYLCDTLCMARALHGVDVGGSLAHLAQMYQIGVKGDEVVAAEGKRREMFTPEDLAQYGRYCCNDVELTYTLYNRFANSFPESEMDLINQTLRMFIQPKLYVDEPVLHERLASLHEERSELLGKLKEQLQCQTEDEVAEKLSSNKKFAEVLTSFDVQVPMKTSPVTGKEAPALAKKDEGFLALCDHEDTFIQNLCAARLGVKSTLEEKRIQRFIDIGRRNAGRIPIPLKYYGAHTGRWAGYDKVNFQNLPSRDVKKKALKNAIVPPEGYVIINSDSSQIEARVLAWLAGQDDVVKMFAEKQDVYRIMASKIFKCKPEEVTEEQRFIGKTVILGCGYGTGWAKLQSTLAVASPPRVVTEVQAREIIDVYREANHKIKELWAEGDLVLRDLVQWQQPEERYEFGKRDCLKYDRQGFILPNGFRIRYPELKTEIENNKTKYVYKSRKGPVSIWGGTIVENVVQALARCIVGEQLVNISKHYNVALTVHDSVVCIAPADEVEQALQVVTGIMSTTPSWAEGLPIACKATFGPNYGDC